MEHALHLFYLINILSDMSGLDIKVYKYDINGVCIIHCHEKELYVVN